MRTNLVKKKDTKSPLNDGMLVKLIGEKKLGKLLKKELSLIQ